MRRRALYPNHLRRDQAARSVRRFRSKVRTLYQLGIIILGIQLVAFALTSPHLQIRNISVEGAGDIVQPWVQERMETAVGRNIILFSAGRLAERIQNHSIVRTASVKKNYPHGLVAKVQERKPYVCVKWGTAYYLMDVETVPFRKVDRPVRDLPLLSAEAAGSPELGKPWTSVYVNALVRALEAARDRDLAVTRVAIDPSGDMCLNVDNGIEIRAGSPQDIEQKIWAASGFLMSRVVPLNDILYVDVSIPSALAYRPRGGQSDASIQ